MPLSLPQIESLLFHCYLHGFFFIKLNPLFKECERQLEKSQEALSLGQTHLTTKMAMFLSISTKRPCLEMKGKETG